MDSLDKEIKYSHDTRGLCEETYENVESVNCVGDREKDSSVLIIGHDDGRSNTVLKNIDQLHAVKDIKTV